MAFDQIDQLKQQYTDKYVVVDAQRPELARFHDTVGQVKTVNMSGRALVEFGDYHLNIGWYDIDLAFLKVVDKPAPKPIEKEVPAKKPPGEPASAGGKQAAPAKPEAKPAPAGKPSTADILAALRGGGAAKPAAPKPAAAKTQVEDRPRRAKPAPVEEAAAEELAGEPASAGGEAPAKPSADKVDKKSMSIDQIIAWCRQHDAK